MASDQGRAGWTATDSPLCVPCRVGNCAGHGRSFVNGTVESCAHEHPDPECGGKWDTEHDAHATWHHTCNLPLRHEGPCSCRECGAELWAAVESRDAILRAMRLTESIHVGPERSAS